MSKLSFLEMQVEDFALFSEPKLLHPQFKFSRFVYLSENSTIYSRGVSSPKKKKKMKNASHHSLWLSDFRIGDILHALSCRGLSMVTIVNGVTQSTRAKTRKMRLLLEALQTRIPIMSS